MAKKERKNARNDNNLMTSAQQNNKFQISTLLLSQFWMHTSSIRQGGVAIRSHMDGQELSYTVNKKCFVKLQRLSRLGLMN